MIQFWLDRDNQLWIDRDSQIWHNGDYSSTDTGITIGSLGNITKELLLQWEASFLEADFIYDKGDLTRDQGFVSAVIISLFSDRLAAIDTELPDINSADRRGWWGDIVSPDVEGDKIGSHLWLLERSKTTEKTLTDAKQYTEEALEWFIEDGIASSIDVIVERQPSFNREVLAIQAKITLIDGNIAVVRFLNDLLQG